MDQSTFNHGKSGDTNPKGRSRSPLLELYTRSLRNEREEKIGHRTSAACGGRLRLCYTLDEGKESERETTNCPPKRVRSSTCCRHYPGAATGCLLCSLPQSYQPSPKGLPGRSAHRHFRGLLGVHSRCGLHTRAVTVIRDMHFPKASTVSLPPQLLR